MALLPCAAAAQSPTAPHPGAASARAERAGGVPAARVAALARGFNLPEWLEGPAPRRPDFALLASLFARGFTHIRLPVAPEPLVESFAAAGEPERRVLELDLALDVLTRIGFAVTIDIHPGRGLGALQTSDPERALAILEKLWARLAHRYASRSPERVFFEPLNEPTFAPAIWKAGGERIVETIRRAAPRHTIISGDAGFQRIDRLTETQPVAQENLVYAVHFYDPMVFTHQGLDWSEDPLRYLEGVPFPGSISDRSVTGLIALLTREGRIKSADLLKEAFREPWTENRIEDEIDQAGLWSARHRRPVVINEFGALARKARPSDRARWIATVRRAAERNCLGWTHWDYAGGFGFVDRVAEREIPDERIIRALLGGHAGP